MYSKLPTASLSVAELLSGAFRFTVPPYQRAYSWTREEAGQLLEDLMSAAGLDDPAATDPDYFLGTILLMDRSGQGDWPGEIAAARAGFAPPSDAERVVDIVDGQQRVVTLSVLSAVLRDLDSAAESESWSRLDGLLALPGTGRPGSVPRRFRLELPASDQDYIARYVLAPGATTQFPAEDEEDDGGAGARSLIDVREHFIAVLSGFEIDARRVLANYICDRAHVVAILTRDIDRAHRYFKVLNDRGRPLMRSDILKAEVLSEIPAARSAEAHEVWDRANRVLGDKFDPFFAHLRSIYGSNRGQVINAVRSVVTAAGGAEPFVLRALSPMSDAYRQILGAESGVSGLPPDLERPLAYLSRLNGEEWVPSAMLSIRRHHEGDLSGIEFLSEIDRQAHLMRLLLIGRDKRVSRFSAISAAIRSGQSLQAASALFEPSRDEIKAIAFNLQSLWRRNPSFAKLLLLRIADEIRGTMSRVDPAVLSVEHILPQRPSKKSNWKRDFKDADEREALTQCLGNLVLVSVRRNDALSNDDFDQKRSILARTDSGSPEFALLSDVIKASTWGPSEVRGRDARMTKLVGQLFRIDVNAAGGRR